MFLPTNLKLKNSIFLILRFFKKLSIKKIINFFGVWFSYVYSSIFKRPYRPFYPFSISVEVSGFCNLRCPECPLGAGKLTRKQGNMDFDLFKKIIDTLHPYLLNVFLYFQGEPFLNPMLFDMIKYAADKNIFVSLSTNGHFLTEKNAKKLIKSGLDYLIISIDGITQEVYEKYRIGGNLNTVLNGFKTLIKQKKILKSLFPFTEIQFLVLKTNEDQMSKALKIFKKLNADKISFKTAQIYENFDFFVPENKKFARYERKNGKWFLKKKLKNRCWRLWNSVVFTWDGNVLPCCYDKDAKYSFGNIKISNFDNLYNNERFKHFALKVLTNRKSIDICRNCNE